MTSSGRRRRQSRPLGILLVEAALILSVVACESGAPTLPAVPQRHLVETLGFGAVTGSDAYVFGRIDGLALAADGRIFVADGPASEIRAFDRLGRFLFVVAGEGEGPGEVRSPCCVTIGPEGDLWVRDTGNGRYIRYRITAEGAEVRSTVRMTQASPGLWTELTFDRDGRLVDVGVPRGVVPRPGTTPPTVRNHLDGSGQIVRSTDLPSPSGEDIGLVTVEGVTSTGAPSLRFFYQPLGPRDLLAHAPGGGWARGLSSGYEIDWTTSDESTRIHVSGRAASIAVPDSIRAEAEAQFAAQIEARGLRRGDVDLEVPGSHMPLRDLWFDRSGRLWVWVRTEAGSPNRADVYAPDGSLVETVRWPADVRLHTVGYVTENEALGVKRDELGVERVVRLRLEGG